MKNELDMKDVNEFRTLFSSLFGEDKEEKVEPKEEKSPSEQLNEFIQNQMKEVVDNIIERCKCEGTRISFVENGFEVITKYSIPDDLGTVYDKTGLVLNLGDKVKTKVYYGELIGTIVDIDFLHKVVYVKSSSGDVFIKKGDECFYERNCVCKG